MEPFYQHRPLDVNLNFGVGSERGAKRFYGAGERDGVNSFRREMVEQYGNPITHAVDVKVVTLMDIIRDFADGKFPDFLSLDIEGWELPVLASMDYHGSGIFDGFQGPTVICVEAECGNTQIGAELKSLLTARGYFLYCWAGANMFFIRNSWRHAIYTDRAPKRNFGLDKPCSPP